MVVEADLAAEVVVFQEGALLEDGKLTQMIPKWASNVLSPSAFEQVESAIAMAEGRTSGEIVPMVVKRSSTIGHVPIIVFLLTWLTCEILDLATAVGLDIGHWSWELIYAFVAFCSAAILSRFTFVQRWLINSIDRIHQVNMRAELEFFEANLSNTKEKTGILIFVSLMEHRVTVLADSGIASKLPSSTWDEVVKRILKGIKTKNLGEGLSDGVALCGDVLALHFPRSFDDKNELHDHLIIKE